MHKKAALTTSERNRLARKRKLEREVQQYFQNIAATSTMSLEEKIERYKSDGKRRKQTEKITKNEHKRFERKRTSKTFLLHRL